MMDTPKTYRVIRRKDLGNVIARADFLEQTIELNDAIYPKLSPMTRELVMCHEVCHLAYGEHDENRTQQLAEELFLSRAKSDSDRELRHSLLGKDGGRYGNSVMLTLAIIGTVLSVGISGAKLVAQRNSGWYQWPDELRKQRFGQMLEKAFEDAKLSGVRTPSDFLWEQLNVYTAKDKDFSQFVARSENAWVKTMIPSYEQRYGFGFNETYKRRLSEKPWFKAVAAVVVGLAVYLAVDAVRE